MKRTLTIISIISVVFLGFGLWFGLNFKPGSYPDAEHYKVDATEDDLIAAIITFKRNTPEYNVPKGVGLIDGRKTKNSHWYLVYFYLPETNQILLTWTRPEGPNRTTFALVSVNDGLIIGNWKQLNRDELGRQGTKKMKQEFETKILVNIKQLLKKPKP